MEDRLIFIRKNEHSSSMGIGSPRILIIEEFSNIPKPDRSPYYCDYISKRKMKTLSQYYDQFTLKEIFPILPSDIQEKFNKQGNIIEIIKDLIIHFMGIDPYKVNLKSWVQHQGVKLTILQNVDSLTQSLNPFGLLGVRFKIYTSNKYFCIEKGITCGYVIIEHPTEIVLVNNFNHDYGKYIDLGIETIEDNALSKSL